ncbi:MAG: hypothetical protein HYY06_24245 [Deltaproteobacteria bacterium]|nr:hypothetical protein [Deltaproteobacteria bacterium]
MATKKRGNGKVADLTVEILREIRDQLQLTNKRLEKVEKRLESLEKLQVATVAGLNDLRSRFDNLLEFAGDRYRDHEQRLRALEQRASREQ